MMFLNPQNRITDGVKIGYRLGPHFINNPNCHNVTYLFHTFHFWNVKLQHVLNPAFQGDDGAGAAGAGALELQPHDAIFEAAVDHVTPILLHSRPVATGHSEHI